MRKPLLPQVLLAAAFLTALAGLITNGYRIACASSSLDLAGTDLRTTNPERAQSMGCLSCHEGIEDIREERSDMLAQILAKGAPLGDPGGCVVCHGETGKGDGIGAAALDPKPRNYTDAGWQASVTDSHIKQVIVQGGAANGLSPTMPPHPQFQTKEAELAQIVAFIRSLSGK